jgi:hypothetical protein
MYLLDTNVISDGRKRVPPVMRWLDEVGRGQSYLSVVSLGEIEAGIVKLQRRDSAAGSTLAQWFAGVRQEFDDRILPIDERVALAWGRIIAGRTRNIADALIAATAQVHRLTLVTRNVRDFADLDLPLIDPWAAT